MSRPVERWLGTFMCTQYADTFEAHGYKTLQSVCQLDFNQLQSMGVRPEHCEKIMENVSVLRQSYIGSGGAASVGPKDALPTNPGAGHGGCGFNISDRRTPSTNYAASQMGMVSPQRMPDYPVSGQMPLAPRYPYNQNQMYNGPQYSNYISNQMNSQMVLDNNQMWPNSVQGPYSNQRQQSGQYNMNTGQYHPNQQHYSGQNRMYSGGGGDTQRITDMAQNCIMQQPSNSQSSDCMGNSPASSMQSASSGGPSRQGSANGMQSSMAPNACGGQMAASQSPQQVADSILQMASSTFQSNVSHKMTMGTRRFRHGYGVGSMPSPQQPFSVPQPPGQYCYPGNQSVGSPLSPIQVRSPASAQNSQCITSASPSPMRSPVGSTSEHCPMSSPAMTGMQSPVPNMRQPMCSPIQGNPPMSTCSPVPHMNVAAQSSSSPGHGHHSVLPPSSPMSQMNPNSHPPPSPLTQLKSPGHHPSSVLSPGHPPGVNYSPNSAVQHSNEHLYHSDCYPSASSETDYINYTSMSSPRHYTELQPACKPSTSTNSSYVSQYSTSKCTDSFNPLQSLQKLVMLPESQVVDPKSVVSDANMLSPEGSKYDDGSALLPDVQLSSPIDQQFLSNSEQACSDGKHCGTDVEEDVDSKFLTQEDGASKDENTKAIDGPNKKCRTRKKRSKKDLTNLEVGAVTSELEQPVKQKVLRRRGRKQMDESFEDSAEQQHHIPSSKSSRSDQGPSDQRSVSGTHHPKHLPTKDLVHYSETSIRHCTVELEDISPLKNGRTQFNGFGDYTLLDVKNLGCIKLDNCQKKRSREDMGSISQTDITVLDEDDLKLSPRAKRIRKRNQSLNVDDRPPTAQLSSPVKQNGIHKGVEKSGCCLMSLDGIGDRSEDLKTSDKPKNCKKSLFNGKCTEKLGDLQLNGSSAEIMDMASDKHKARQLTSSESVKSSRGETTVNSAICENGVTKVGTVSKQTVATSCDKVKVTSNVNHNKSSVAASISLHDDSLDCNISNNVNNRDLRISLTAQNCCQGNHKTEQVSSHEETYQNVCTDNVPTENTLSYAQIASTIPQNMEEQVDKAKTEHIDQHKNKTQCNGIFSGYKLKSSQTGNIPGEKFEKDMENNLSEALKAKVRLELKALERCDESKCNVVDCCGIAVSSPVKDTSETHLYDKNSETLHCQSQHDKQAYSGHGKQKTELANVKFLNDKIGTHLQKVASVAEKSPEFENSNHCFREESKTEVDTMDSELTEKHLPIVKQRNSEGGTNGASITLVNNFDSGICNGMSPTNSDSPTKASDKENPLELDVCKGRRRRPLTLAPKVLDYSSDENAEREEAKVSKYKRLFGSRSPKLSCVENKNRDKSFISVASVKNHNSVIECNSKPTILKDKSSLDLIVNRLNQHVVEKQVLTVAPVYVLSSQNKVENTVEKASTANTCNHTSNKRMLRNSSAKSFHSNSSTFIDNGVSNKVPPCSAPDEGREYGKQENQPVNDKCNPSVPSSANSRIVVLNETVSDGTSLQTADHIKTEPAVQGSTVGCGKNKADNEHYSSAVQPDALNNFDIRQPQTDSQPSSSHNKAKNGPSHGGNGIRIRSKSRRTKKRYRSFTELGSEDEKLRKLFKIKSERKQKKDHMKSKQDSHLPKGPYVKVTGNRNLPESFVVVNLCHGDTDKQKLLKGYSRPESHLDPGSEALMKMSSSTPWVCVFCGRGSNEDGTGDLFGPYFFQVHSSFPSPVKSSDSLTPKVELTGDTSCATKSRVKKKAFVLENKSAKGKCHTGSVSGRKIKTPSPPEKGIKGLNNRFSKETELLSEVWMHEDCVVWTSGVFAMGGKIHGLEEALHVAKHSFCSVCKNSGATLGCFQKACNQKYHYICALNTDCYMDEENFSLLCQKHKEKRLKLSGPENG